MKSETPVIVTISRQLASGGAYIGQRVAQRLGFRYVDHEILKQAAAALGCENEAEVEPLEEHAGNVWSRISRAIAVGAPDAPFAPPSPLAFDEGDVLQAETLIIRKIAEAEAAVIVGRGATHMLQGRDNVIRVFIHAPKDIRIAEVERTYHLEHSAARAMLERSDKDRAHFVQSLIGRSWTDACLYDLTIDTSVVPRDLAVDLLVGAVAAQNA
jgi:cytidylate kinase